MRLTTLASAAVLALSTAVIIQVGSAPEEQKLAGNDAAIPDETGPPTGNNVAESGPGAPSTALVNSIESKQPR